MCRAVRGSDGRADRETAARIQHRRDEGCITVEMEVAACLAVARHRGVTFAPYVCRQSLFDLAVEAALEL